MITNTNFFYNLSLIPGLSELIHSDKTDDSFLNKHESITTNNQTYKVIRYKKDLLSEDYVRTYGLCRSIVVNSENKIVSFSPPKSISSEKFLSNLLLENIDKENIIAQEFVEGTMINVFFNSSDTSQTPYGSWEITTRNTVGAMSSFYKYHGAKTFRQMFLEALTEHNFQFSDLNPSFCYSFVLQHPENRIVVPFHKPQLYLIAVYQIIHFHQYNQIIWRFLQNQIYL